MTTLLIGTAAAAALAGLVLQAATGAAHGEDLASRIGPEAGETFLTVQWCDTQEAMVRVVERHAAAGEAAADAAWDELSNYGLCHTVAARTPAVATLIEETHTTVVTMSDPLLEGSEQPAVVQVWRAKLDGITDRAVYIARGAMLQGGQLV